jgi:hypothetical protein
MPKRLAISPKDKTRIFKLYASGLSPLDISLSLRDKNLTSRQIANLVSREGWTRRKAEIAEVKQQNAQEVLASVRASGVRDLEEVLSLVADGLKIDAQKLKDAWQLVGDAADASSLQRAKTLHLSRVLKLHGLDVPVETGTGTLNVFFGNPIGQAEPVPVEPVKPEVPAHGADDTSQGSVELDFED